MRPTIARCREQSTTNFKISILLECLVETLSREWDEQKRTFREWLMKRNKTISAVLVEFQCEKCNAGAYRVDDSREPVANQWFHICSNCGDEVYFAYPYPYIEYKGEAFILRKHVPRQSPSPDI